MHWLCIIPGPGYATCMHLRGDCCINQSIFERPPCSPYGPLTRNSFTFHVSKVRPTWSENISKIQGGRIRCAPCKNTGRAQMGKLSCYRRICQTYNRFFLHPLSDIYFATIKSDSKLCALFINRKTNLIMHTAVESIKFRTICG
jgi:hypothetical protein